MLAVGVHHLRLRRRITSSGRLHGILLGSQHLDRETLVAAGLRRGVKYRRISRSTNRPTSLRATRPKLISITLYPRARPRPQLTIQILTLQSHKLLLVWKLH